jgi:hypothetical protein
LIRDQGVQVCPSGQKRLLTAPGMMEALHHEERAVPSILRLIQQGTCHRQVRVCEDRIPARLLVLEPSPDAFSVAPRMAKISKRIALS